MLLYDPMERITAKVARAHQFLGDLAIGTALPPLTMLYRDDMR